MPFAQNGGCPIRGRGQTDAVADDLSPTSRIATRPRYRGYIIAVVVVSLLLTVAVGIGNYALNPLSYNYGFIRDAAGALDSGQGFANYDTNINWRALRREQIEAMTTTPDVIVFGGSRWWEAHMISCPARRSSTPG